MKAESLNNAKERLRNRLDNSGFVRAIGWEDNENMITGWTSFTVTLFFLNGHLPEVQHRVCDCVREYASLIGKEAKFYMSPVSSRLHLAKNGAAGVRLCPGIRFTHRKRSKVLYESRLLPAAPGKKRKD